MLRLESMVQCSFYLKIKHAQVLFYFCLRSGENGVPVLLLQLLYVYFFPKPGIYYWSQLIGRNFA